MRARLSDVADIAGVSTSTASLVLSGKGARRISAATSARVRSAAAQLHYVPRAQRDATLGVGLILEVQGSGDVGIEAVEVAQAEAWRLGHGPVLAARLRPEGDVDGVATALLERGVAGLLYFGQECGPVQPVTLGVPTVYANCYPIGGDAADRRHVVVRADERNAAREAALLVLRRGHRRAAFVQGAMDEDVVRLWRSVASSTWAEAGLTERPEFCVVSPADLSSAERLFRGEPASRPTAFVCLDPLAVEAVRRLVAAPRHSVPPGAFVVARGPVGHPFLRPDLPGLPELPVTVGPAVSDLASVGIRMLLDGAKWRAGPGMPTHPNHVLLPVRVGGGTPAAAPQSG